MQESKKREQAWHFLVGILVADVGMLLIGLGGWDALHIQTRIPMYISGTIFLLGGLSLIWMDAIRLDPGRHKPMLRSKGTYLGTFQLNDYLFEAYERESNNGRREFRLVSSPSISPAQEAAFVRYMIHEGLVENMWPQMSEQIEEEAHWAFLP